MPNNFGSSTIELEKTEESREEIYLDQDFKSLFPEAE